MPNGARRPLLRRWGWCARRALLTVCLCLLGAGAALACRAPSIAQAGKVPGTTVTWPGDPAGRSGPMTAWYADLTDRYGHAVLGDGMEPSTLRLTSSVNTTSLCSAMVRLDPPHVFEDVAPRLVDLTGDGLPEVITVRSHATQGAQLAIYALDPEHHQLSLMATTPYIGTRFRWLAPLGAADLDGDGAFEIAYVDRPHLAKTLRIWRFENGGLREVANLAGVTNHRIGERDIAGGIRTCNGTPEMILADAGWSALLALRFENGQITSRVVSQDTSRPAFARAMRCANPS